MKKNILTISICVSLAVLIMALILFVSCQNSMYTSKLEVIVDSGNNTKEVVSGDIYTFSIDNVKENESKFLRIRNRTYDSSGLDLNALNTYEVSDDLRTTTDSTGTITIRLSDIKTPSTYTIVAHSSVQSVFPQSFIINATSELTNIKASYELTNSDKDKIKVEEKYKNGDITFKSNSIYAEKEVSLIKGGEYLLKISSAQEGIALNEVEVYSNDDSIVVVQDRENTECRIRIVGENDTQTFIGIKPIGSDIIKKVQIKSVDLATIEITEEKEKRKSEEMICLNVGEELTRKVEYIGLVAEDLRFSLNAEVIEQDRYYLDEDKEYIPEMNTNAYWVSHYTLTQKNESGTEMFSVKVNSEKKTFTIKGLENTTYEFNSHPNPEMMGEKNLHYYLYIKGKNDLKYRKKIRIIIGGVLEGMEIYEMKENQETLVDKPIEIKDEKADVDWNFRVKYIPSTYQPNDTIFYISGISENGDYNYTTRDKNGSVISTKKINLPIPSGTSKDGIRVNKFKNGTVALNNDKDVKGGEDGDIIGEGDLRVLKYSEIGNNEQGYQEISVNYMPNNNGEDIRIVALSKYSGLYTTVTIKQSGKAGLILKSITMRANKVLVNKPTEDEQIPYGVRTKSISDKSIKDTKTPYKEPSYTQEYPNTITADNPSERTFYIHVNGILDIDIEATFPLESPKFIRSDEANKYLFGEFSEDNTNTKKRRLTISTMWSKMSISDKKEDCKNVDQVNRQYLTDSKGVKTHITFIKDGTEYSIPINIVIYSTSDSKFS